MLNLTHFQTSGFLSFPRPGSFTKISLECFFDDGEKKVCFVRRQIELSKVSVRPRGQLFVLRFGMAMTVLAVFVA